MTSHQVSFSGREIPMSELPGEGTQLLLVPGMGAGREMWDQLRGALKVPTTAFDIPLFLNPFGSLPTMENYADAMLAICDDRGYEQVDVLGVSWGGVLAITFALRHPGRLRRLILASTTPDPITHFLTHPEICLAYLLKQYGGTIDHGPHSHGNFREVTWETMMSDGQRALSLLRWSCRDQLEDIPNRTLIITGASDRIVPLNEAKRSCAIPNSEFFEIPDEGHLCVMTSDGPIVGKIEEFLDGTD